MPPISSSNIKSKPTKQKSGASSITLRHRWSKEDDAKLIRVVTDATINKKKLRGKCKVKQHAQTNWSTVASKFPGRCPADCRKRWMQVENITSTGHSMWSNAEDKMIIKLHREHGNRWRFISSFMPGRTDNAVKNRFNTLSRKNSLDIFVHEGNTNEDNRVKPYSPPHKRSVGVYNVAMGAKKKMKTDNPKKPMPSTTKNVECKDSRSEDSTKEVVAKKPVVSSGHGQHIARPSTPPTVPKSLAYVSAHLSQMMTTQKAKRPNSNNTQNIQQHKIVEEANPRPYSFNPVMKYQPMPNLFHRAIYPPYFIDNLKPTVVPAAATGSKKEKHTASIQPGISQHATASSTKPPPRLVPKIVTPRDEEHHSNSDDRRSAQSLSFKVEEDAMVDREPLVPLPYFPVLPNRATDEAKFWDVLSPFNFFQGKNVALPPLDGEVSEFLSQSFGYAEGGPAVGVLV
mmetsp:Transcript_4744/g.7212  ORF Transcript_4744/g.7212 Transcript_4744/m.7212 type:complete len:456 (-) Transcript_4744:235-1602(-)|eukprot:CAMPEP_0196823406 /NCGR_PEP_ID=MMETSP1362-20130617/87279_1 /TAXON_ID=163516 /ORGANISM="Leptocylindrus danicus, Strain CCMP1856" /LENGTH=455 /DNA_ID=CAMNT_0042203253 /DNA_START=38 /DNA_END=1405 /DNA_ORIENTATION=-